MKFEKIYKDTIYSAPTGMHFYKLINDELIFVDANPAAKKMLNVGHDILFGLTMEKAFPGIPGEIIELYKKDRKSVV